MSQLHKEIQEPYLSLIKRGEKKYEGRLWSKVVEWNLVIGTPIRFYNNSNSSYVDIEVVSLRRYDDFGAAYDDLKDELLPNSTRSCVISIYNHLFHDNDEDVELLNQKNSTSNRITREGVVAIGIKML